MSSSQQDKYRRQLSRAWQLIGWLKNHTNHWCPIVSSPEIKKAILNRITELGMSAEEVVVRADVSWASFKKHYLDTEEPFSRPSIRPEDLRRIMRVIGLDMKIAVIHKKRASEMDREQILRDGYIPHEQRKKNKRIS